MCNIKTTTLIYCFCRSFYIHRLPHTTVNENSSSFVHIESSGFFQNKLNKLDYYCPILIYRICQTSSSISLKILSRCLFSYRNTALTQKGKTLSEMFFRLNLINLNLNTIKEGQKFIVTKLKISEYCVGDNVSI